MHKKFFKKEISIIIFVILSFVFISRDVNAKSCADDCIKILACTCTTVQGKESGKSCAKQAMEWCDLIQNKNPEKLASSGEEARLLQDSK